MSPRAQCPSSPAGRRRIAFGARGNAAGPVLFALVAVAVLLLGYLWLDGRRASNGQHAGTNPMWSGATDKWTDRLGRFLAAGPEDGTWETRYLSSTCRHYLREHPSRPGLYQIAEVTAKGPRGTKTVSRWLVPRHFFRAPSSLFFSNYRRSAAKPEREVLPDGTDTWRVHWVPHAHPDGLTERRVWFSVANDEVVQVEDRSREGHLIRRVRLVSRDTGDWDPEALVDDPAADCIVEPPDPDEDPERLLLDAVDEAPFPVYVPTHIPAGFVLVRSSYTICNAARTTERLQGEPLEVVSPVAKTTPVRLVTQLYSDGMALISLAVASKDDMDVIEDVTSQMGAEAGPGSCPGLPADPRDVRTDNAMIRMRTDVCRTVFRRDDFPDVSVTLIGRNELPAEEYLRMMGSLRQVESVRRSSK